jgi:hypothetical protein
MPHLVAMVPATLLVILLFGTDKFYKLFQAAGHHQSRDGELWYDADYPLCCAGDLGPNQLTFVGLQNRTLC